MIIDHHEGYITWQAYQRNREIIAHNNNRRGAAVQGSPKKGKGLFASQLIEKGTVIDIANVILIPNKEYKRIKKTVLYDYCYIWEDPKLKPEYKNAIL